MPCRSLTTSLGRAILIIETKDLRRLKRQRLLARLPRIRDFRTKVIVIDVDVDVYGDVDHNDDD